MSHAFRQQAGIFTIAICNGIFVYPYLKQYYRKYYSVKLQPGDPTHYVSHSNSYIILVFLNIFISFQAYFDIEIDGKDVGRLDFELFGKESPKTVNNFLAFCTGDFNPYLRYKGTNLLNVYE